MTQRRKQPAQSGSAVWAVVITSLAGFITALDNLVVTTALPSIRKDLGGGRRFHICGVFASAKNMPQ